MLPLSDAPNPTGTPVVTYLLIALNVLVFVLFTLPLSGQAPTPGDPRIEAYVSALRESLPPDVPLRDMVGSMTEYDLLVFEHGYKPGAPQWADMLVAMFLHGGFMHLFGNMLFLWIYGDNVEHRLGRVKYLLWYVATGIAATMFFALLDSDSLVPMVGASGAISGVLGFYFWWFPRNVVRVLVLLFPILVRVVEIPARIVLGIYLFIDNVLPWLVTGGGSGGGVAHGAHIGGFVAGVAAAFVIARRQVAATPQGFEETAPAVGAPADGAASALRRGDMATAARAYFALPASAARDALDPDQAMTLAAWLADHGHGAAALSVYQRYIQQHPRGERVADAHVGAGMALLQHLDQPTTAYQHFTAALGRQPTADIAMRAQAGLASVAGLQKSPARFFS